MNININKLSFFQKKSLKLKLAIFMLVPMITMGASAQQHCVRTKTAHEIKINCTGPLSPRAARTIAKGAGSVWCAGLRMLGPNHHYRRNCWQLFHRH